MNGRYQTFLCLEKWIIISEVFKSHFKEEIQIVQPNIGIFETIGLRKQFKKKRLENITTGSFKKEDS